MQYFFSILLVFVQKSGIILSLVFINLKLIPRQEKKRLRNNIILLLLRMCNVWHVISVDWVKYHEFDFIFTLFKNCH